MINQTKSSINLSTSLMATREGFGVGLAEVGQNNPDVFALCADLTDSLKMTSFKEKFPDRFVQVGVAEQNLIGVAAGLSLAGKIPFAGSFSVFSPARSWDQIRVSVAYGNLNVKIIGSHAGLVTGQDGASHQALEDIAIMRVLPNMKVIEPCDAEQARQAVHALAADQGPAYLRLVRMAAPTVSTNHQFKIGKAQVLQAGEDVTIIACGTMIHEALLAAQQLKDKNISVRVINMHTIKPIDKDAIIKAAQETQVIITAEDHQINGGLGSAVAEVLLPEIGSKVTNHVKFGMVGVEDSFGESGDPEKLKEKYGLTAEKIKTKIYELLQ